jgi:hypothetical protein
MFGVESYATFNKTAISNFGDEIRGQKDGQTLSLICDIFLFTLLILTKKNYVNTM